MGKGGKVEVWDYLLSVDYGLCMGPIDFVTEVWVKDKPIFCGLLGENTSIDVDQPGLFGGDTGEGGCVGVVEAYMGTDSQMATPELASRHGVSSPSQTTAHRGVAHLFFRGKGSPRGFRWTTNNPYFPETKASVVSLPKSLGLLYSSVYPFSGSYNPAGEPIPFSDFLFGAPDMDMMAARQAATGSPSIPTNAETIFPVSTYPGFAGGRIDGGTGYVTAVLFFSPQGVTVGTPPPAAVAYNFQVRFYDASGTFISSLSASGGTTTDITVTVEGPVPPGTRSISLVPTINPFVPVFTRIRNGTINSTLNFNAGAPYDESSTLHCDPNGDGLGRLPNANPAHMIYECLVNAEWGKGESPAMIDQASFLSCAQTLQSELFGLSMMWTQQTEIENFIQEILDHIQAVLFQDPGTGLWTLRLLRADYNASTLAVLGPTNCVARNRKRKAWGETINEIVVTYTDPRTEEEATVVSHNLASIAIQGGVISEGRNYHGIRDPWLAQFVADRDVHAAGYPLFGCQLEVDRREWMARPGDVRKFTWPEDGITEMVIRVLQVDYGTPSDRTITLEVAEDIYGLERTDYGAVQGSAWTPDRAFPSVLDAQMAMTAPLGSLIRVGGDLAEVDARAPGVLMMLLGDEDGLDPLDIEAHTSVPLLNGGSQIEPVAKFLPTRSGVLPAILVAEAQSRLPDTLIGGMMLGSERPGDLFLIGTSEAASEIVMLDSYDSGTDEWVVARGVWDTVPRLWTAGTRIWRLPGSTSNFDPGERVPGEDITYRFLPRATEGRLPYADAPDVDVTATARPHMPFRPANAQLAGAGFGIFAQAPGDPAPATIEATWVNRNRRTEDQLVKRWTEANVTPETGQTVTLKVHDGSGALVNTISGLTGTSYTLDVADDLLGTTYGFVDFYAERDGLESLMAARRWFDIRSGYGVGYGLSYGP